MMKRVVFITQQKQTGLPSSFTAATPTTHVIYAMKEQVAVITLSGLLINLTKKLYYVEAAAMN